MYAAALQHWVKRVKNPSEMAVAIDEETELGLQCDDLRDVDCLAQAGLYFKRKMKGELKTETLADWWNGNRKSYPNTSLHLPNEPRTVLLPQGNETGSNLSQWAFVVQLSKVGFNKAQDQALVYIGNHRGLLNGEGLLYLVERKQNKWRVTRVVMLWIS